MIGPAYLASAIILGLVTVTVYTAARDVDAGVKRFTTNALRRAAQLYGVLILLAVVVFLLGKF